MPKVKFSETFSAQIRVKGSGNNEYIVTMLGMMPQSCTCPNFEHRAGPMGEFCKHMKARHGRKAIGVTRCASCMNWLTPEELSDINAEEGTPGSATCDSCE